MMMSVMTIRLVALAVLCYYTVEADYPKQNAYMANLEVVCPSTQALYRFESDYHWWWDDRRWAFVCRSFAPFSKGVVAEWYNNVHPLLKELNFVCPEGNVLCGVKSWHHDWSNDRQWSFRCCRPNNDQLVCNHKNLDMSPVVNGHEAPLRWQVPCSNMAMVGFQSIHNTWHHDRRWRVRMTELNCGNKCTCGKTFDSNWEFLQIEYELNRATVDRSVPPEVLATKSIDNSGSSASAQQTFSISEEISDSFSYSVSHGVSIEASMSFEAGIPFLGETGFELSVGYTNDQTWGEEKSVSRSWEASFTLDVGPGLNAKATIMLQKVKISEVPYTMTLRHKTLNCRCQVEGFWNGLQGYSLVMRTEDVKGRSVSGGDGINVKRNY